MTDTQLVVYWDGAIIFVSYVVAVIASYSTVTVIQHERSPAMSVAAAFTLSVSGIWSMHFIGMEAMFIGIRVDFDVGLTVLSAALALLCAGVAIVIVRWKMPDPAKLVMRGGQRVVMDVSVAAHIEALVAAPHAWLVLSGLIIALGVCAMHYTGMAAMKSAARVVAVPGVIAASVVIAVVAATAALYLAFVIPLSKRFALPTACIMGVAVCAMHYTGMYGFTYHIDTAGAAYAAARIAAPTKAYYGFVVIFSTAASFALMAFSAVRFHARSVDHEYRTEKVLHIFERYVPSGVVRAIAEAEHDATSSNFDTTEYASEGKVSTYVTEHRGDGETDRAGMDFLSMQMFPVTATVMFVDIRDFTHHSETMAPEDLMRTLSIFNNHCSSAVDAELGIVDKYLGDGFMAHWNAVDKVAGHELRSVRAAVACTRVACDFSCRVGIQTGGVVMGNVGSSIKLNFTVMGDTVNQASRFEGLNKFYGTDIIVGDGTAMHLDLVSEVVGRRLGEVRVKGKDEPRAVFEVMALGTDEPSHHEAQQARAAAYDAARDMALAGRTAEAVALLEGDAGAAADGPSRVLLQRCHGHLQLGGDAPFDAVTTFSLK
jgi:class 3 adenylate cyclase/NO-binding membrane sensor protein with MHYT domain